MAQTLASMKRKIKSTGELYDVVETMKTMAAVNVGIYERAYHSLSEYQQCIELGLAGILRQYPACFVSPKSSDAAASIVIFGSDQGMVGQYNERLAAVLSTQWPARNSPPRIWTIGERIASKLQDEFALSKVYRVPDSVAGISALVGQLLLDISAELPEKLFLLHNKPQSGNTYETSFRQMFPPDRSWFAELKKTAWPTRSLPDFAQTPDAAFASLYRELIFISLCHASAEALVSENLSRLSAMQRAEKNIEELLAALQQDYNQERQNSITAELFDVIFGYTTLADK